MHSCETKNKAAHGSDAKQMIYIRSLSELLLFSRRTEIDIYVMLRVCFAHRDSKHLEATVYDAVDPVELILSLHSV